MEKGIGIFIERWIDLKELRIYGCDILQDTHKCNIHRFFEWNTPILPEPIYQFWTNLELKGKDKVVSKVLGKEVIINTQKIVKSIECLRVDTCFYDN